jgi:hypothetical protein
MFIYFEEKRVYVSEARRSSGNAVVPKELFVGFFEILCGHTFSFQYSHTVAQQRKIFRSCSNLIKL